MTNRERLNDAYKVERKLGYPWHQICIYLKEIHMPLDAVLKDDTLTDELIARLPSLRTDSKFTYKGDDSDISMASIASSEKNNFYNSEEWRELKEYVWRNTPGDKVCPYCGRQIILNSSWTIHHKLFTDDNVELYKTDKDVLHYSIMHYQCHAMCHRILKESMNKDEIKSLTFMGRAWILSSLKRFL